MNGGTPSNSGSPPAANGGGSAAGKAHTRTYQACLPCRERKVKCDMGPIDGPRQHPCKRCMREDKDCVFSKTRRKDKRNVEDEGSEHDTRDNKRGRSSTVDRVFHGLIAVPGHNPFDPYSQHTSRPTTPRGGPVSHIPLTRPSGNAPPVDHEAAADSMKRLQDAEVFGGHDGIGTLIDAAGHIASRPDHSRTTSFASGGNPRNVAGSFAAHVAQLMDVKPPGREGRDTATNGGSSNGQPAGPAVEQAIRVWNRLRFVRAGLFTAKEGMAYVDYFYKYLYPLTPIRIANFRHPDTHAILLETEPMLLVTILTITSRYMKLAGAGGEYSRPSVIHEKLWTHLRGMVERFIWAQEQFGGGFCGAGAQAAKRVDPSEGLRTLGTIESFMLLTEWHPRALHFPPGDDDAQLLVPENPHDDPTMHQDVPLYANNTGGQRRDGWLEPCWRSDRMSWMLLSHALSLAFEVGVFDRMTEADFMKLNHQLPGNKVKAYFDRKTQLKELLWIYYVQTSGRLELISSLPKDFLETLHQTAADQHIRKIVPSRIKKISQNIVQNLDNVFSPATPPHDFLEAPHDSTLKFWQWIAAIMKSGNQTLFANREDTRDIIQSKQYERYLDVYRSLLHEWRTEFDACTNISKHMRYILEIEYQYSRVYLHSLALQAVITRCAANSPNKRNLQLQPTGRSNSETSRSTQGLAIPPNLVQKWMEPKDLNYIRDVVDGCHKVLEVVVYSLRPDEYLKHCPVRTYFRIMSVTTILLKTFVLGNYADQMKKSLQLLDQTVVALRTCSVDDVHVGNNFADICENLSSMMNGLLLRVAANPAGTTTGAASRAQSQSPLVAGSPHMGPTQSNGLPSTSHPMNQHGNQQHQQQQWTNNPTNTQYNLQSIQNMTHPNMQPQQFRADGAFMSLPDNGEYTNSFPLQDVRDYDPGTNEYSIMPPPGGFNAFEPQFSNGNTFDGMNGNNMAGQQVSDWYTLPMDSILQHAGGEVDSTMFGPDLNGMDLLDIFNPRVA